MNQIGQMKEINYGTEDMFVSLAKKYFKLGLKAQKGEKL